LRECSYISGGVLNPVMATSHLLVEKIKDPSIDISMLLYYILSGVGGGFFGAFLFFGFHRNLCQKEKNLYIA